MAYATAADVNALLARNQVSASTDLTTTQLDLLIDMVDGEINAILKAKDVSVPVTSGAEPEFYESLTLCNAVGAAALATAAYFPDQVGPAEQPTSGFFTAWYRRCIDALASGVTIPTSAGQGTSSAPSTYFTRNPDTEEDLGNIGNPQIQVGTEW